MGDDRQDLPLARLPPVGIGGVALVAEEWVGAEGWSGGSFGHGPDAGERGADEQDAGERDAGGQGEGLGDVVGVGRGGEELELCAASVVDQVVFAARLPSVDRNRTSVGVPLFRADAGTVCVRTGPVEFAGRGRLGEEDTV